MLRDASVVELHPNGHARVGVVHPSHPFVPVLSQCTACVVGVLTGLAGSIVEIQRAAVEQRIGVVHLLQSVAVVAVGELVDVDRAATVDRRRPGQRSDGAVGIVSGGLATQLGLTAHDGHVVGQGQPVHAVVAVAVAPAPRQALHGEGHRADVAVVEPGTSTLRAEEALAEDGAVVRVVSRGQRLEPSVRVVGVGGAVAAVVVALLRHLADAVVGVLADSATLHVPAYDTLRQQKA